jgi:hypothetical protein
LNDYDDLPELLVKIMHMYTTEASVENPGIVALALFRACFDKSM